MTSLEFFPEGQERWEASPEYLRLRLQAIAEVRARYAPTLAGAGPLRRLWLRIQLRRAIERAVADLSPPDACFLAADGSTDRAAAKRAPAGGRPST